MQVGQNHFEFLVDSGATVSAINKTGILQESNQTLKTVGIAGIAMSETISKPSYYCITCPIGTEVFNLSHLSCYSSPQS